MANLTVQQYADLRKITPGAVRKAIRLKHNLPGVDNASKFGKSHVLNVAETFIRSQKRILKKFS